MQNFLDFEKPLLEIRSKIEELRHLKDTSDNIANELTTLQEKFDKTLDEIYDNFSENDGILDNSLKEKFSKSLLLFQKNL